MNFSTSIFKKTQIYIHILFGTIVAFLSIYNILNAQDLYYWYEVLITVIVISAFYLHAIPIMSLISRDIKRKYIKYTLLIFGILTIALILISSVESIIQINYRNNTSHQLLWMLYYNPEKESIYVWFSRIFRNNNEQIFFALVVYISSFIYGLTYRRKSEYDSLIKSLKSIKNIELKINISLIILVYIVFWNGSIPKQQLAGNTIFIILIALFYVHKIYIAPYLFKNKNRFRYFSLTLLAFIAALFLIVLADTYLKFSYHSYNNNDVISMFQLAFNVYATVLLIITSLSFLYSYIESSVKAKTINLFRQIGRKDSELKLLKSQVSPHFMFNSLNTLYATALEEKADKTAESITQLADLIRFMQTDIMKESIPLENEISYINNYTSFQLLRCSATQNISINCKNTDDIFVSPGLFIPFVENAFKHGINPSVESELKIEFIYNSGVLTFECTNSICRKQKDKPGMGSGIKNVQKRLDIIYSNNHTFEIIKSDNHFSVLISIKLRKND